MPIERRKPADTRIALVLNRLDGGGIERLWLHLAEHYLDSGFGVDLVLGQKRGDLLAQIPPAAAVFEIAKGHPIRFLPGMIRYLRRRRPDFVLSAFEDVNCLVVLANRWSGGHARVLVSNHSTLSAVRAAACGLRKWKYRLLPALMRGQYRQAQAVVAVSRGVADDLAAVLGLSRERIEVIGNPVITADFETRARQPLPPVLERRDAVPVVTFVGRLAPLKRVDLLLRAFARVREEEAARLWLIGSGPERPGLERLTQSLRLGQSVTFTGFLPNPLPVIRASDVLVLPSSYEGLPSVLIEALGCGTQVVATDCPHGPAEILEQGRWGQLVPVDCEPALAQAMLRAIRKEFRVEPQALKTRAAQFSVATAARRYLSALGCRVA